mmetsp:Transcript_16600/g.28517  ORF Transcript_16600/g.28517 Transcript_16600/m.28517 type:complete len:437 (+) Transcript_16600:563-1873(+)
MARIMDALTALGIDFLARQRWEDQFSSLQEYKKKHGACDVPANHPTLGKWVGTQREYYKLHEQRMPNPLAFTANRFERLRDLGICRNRWDLRLEELKAFKDEHGHCDVPLDYPRLGIWASVQRHAYHYDRENMPQEKIDLLKTVGFKWELWGRGCNLDPKRKRHKVYKDMWNERFNKLVEYIKVHGHSNISAYDEKHKSLGMWVKNQRYEYRKFHNKGLGQSKLDDSRIAKLNGIGFQWRLRPERPDWNARFEALVEYKKEHGHCRVPMNGSDLGKWVKYQRDQYCLFMRGKKCKTNQTKIDKLASLGFEESLDKKVAMELFGPGKGEDEDEEEQEGGREEEEQIEEEHQEEPIEAPVVEEPERIDHLTEMHHPQQLDLAEQAYNLHGGLQHGGQAYVQQYHQMDSDHVYGNALQGSRTTYGYHQGHTHYQDPSLF